MKRPQATPYYGPIAYPILRVFFFILFHTIWPLKIKGNKHIPREGGALIVCNHLSLLDPLVVGFACSRIPHFMAKEELFNTPIIGFFARKLGAFPVDRGGQDAEAIKTALGILREGNLLGMFPEGTRSKSGEMQEFRTGALRLAARTQVPVIPCALKDTNRALPPRKLFRPARIGVSFGEPILFPELYNRNDKGDAMERAVETLRARIQELQDQDAG
jgi:1-acyl-sn-glycerol-3-phosphate acyltransferase